MSQRPDEDARFETDTVDANLAIERGQGVGARELAAPRAPGGVVTTDDDGDESVPPDQSDGGEGLADDDQQLGVTSDA